MKFDDLVVGWVSLCILGGLVTGYFFGYGLQNGLFYGVLIGFGPLILFIVLGLLLNAFLEERPRCKCGNSNQKNSKFISYSIKKGQRYRCRRCGTDWLTQDGVCYEILEDQTRKPFKRENRFGRWVDVE